MAVQFLSDDWMAAISEAVNADEAFRQAADSTEMALQFHVTDVPTGEDIFYVLTVVDGSARLAPGQDEGADAEITNSYETAAAISQGDLNIQMAFMTGKLKVKGNMAKLMMNQGALNQFAKAASSVDVEY